MLVGRDPVPVLNAALANRPPMSYEELKVMRDMLEEAARLKGLIDQADAMVVDVNVHPEEKSATPDGDVAGGK